MSIAALVSAELAIDDQVDGDVRIGNEVDPQCGGQWADDLAGASAAQNGHHREDQKGGPGGENHAHCCAAESTS
jgi:hypothetical protein